MNWDEAVAFALTLPDAELAASYNQPAVKANGNAFLNTGHEPDTSFVLRLELGLTEMLIEAYPATFWKTPHYEGHGAVLVRYDGPDKALVHDLIEQSCERARAKKPPRPRTRG